MQTVLWYPRVLPGFDLRVLPYLLRLTLLDCRHHVTMRTGSASRLPELGALEGACTVESLFQGGLGEG